MELTPLILIVLCLNGILALYKDHVNECGTISHIDPVTNTRPLRLKFLPKKPDSNSVLEWKVELGGELRVLINDTTTISMYEEDDVFYLELTDWKPRDYDYYFVSYGTCESQYIEYNELLETDLGNCGFLYLRPEVPKIGESAKLVFLPAKHILDSSSAFHWQFVPTMRCAPTCQPEDISDKYNVAENSSDAEHILTMLDVNSILNGNYHVLCFDGNTTNSVSIKVPEPPSPPVIYPLLEIAGEEYVVGRDREPLNITCNTTGGTEPVTVQIFLGNSKYPISDGFKPTEKDHNSALTCNVSNAALKEPMKAVTKLYIIKSPANVKLHVNDIVQYRPTNTTCLVNDVRPAPKLYLKIDDEDVVEDSYTYQNDTSETVTTFQSQLLLKNMERKWNGKTLSCCAEHKLYETGTVCSDGKKLSYKFKWEFLSLEFSTYIDEVRPFYMINITCIVQNANPPIEPKWRGKRALFVDKIRGPETQTADKGTTTSNTAVLNVTAENNGDRIQCFTQSSLFGRHEIHYEIRVPAPPKLTINTTNTNMSTANVNVGGSLVLECSVTSEPKSNISWTFDGDNTTEIRTFICDEQAVCLQIAYVFEDHQGTYTCTASNRYGTVTRTIELTVTEQGSEESGLSVVIIFLFIVFGVWASLFILMLIGALIFVIARKTKGKPKKTETTESDTVHKTTVHKTTTKDKQSLSTVSFTLPEKSPVEDFRQSQTAAEDMLVTLETDPSGPIASNMSTFVTDSAEINQDEMDTRKLEINACEDEVVIIEDKEADATELTIDDIHIVPLQAENTQPEDSASNNMTSFLPSAEIAELEMIVSSFKFE